MKVRELIDALEEILLEEPEKADVEIFVYATQDMASDIPLGIDSIDNTMEDRVDINI